MQANWHVSLMLTSMALLLMLGCTPGGGRRAAAIESEVTFAKSFGGPGRDVGYSLAVGPENQLHVFGTYAAPVIGGSEDLPWILGLDRLGDRRYEEAPTLPIGVSSDATYTFGRVVADGGFLFGGHVTSSDTGQDVFLHRLDDAERTLWTLELDSGEWQQTTDFAGARPYAVDHLETVVGAAGFGWFVVTESYANLQVNDGGGARVFVDVPSIVVHFVSTSGDEVWRQRIIMTTREYLDTDRAGPFVETAELTWGPRLTLLVRNLDPEHSGLTLVHIDALGNREVAEDTMNVPDGELFNIYADGSSTGHQVIQTSDPDGDTIDTLRNDGFLVAAELPQEAFTGGRYTTINLEKYDAAGNREWELEIEGPEDARVDALAQTFPDDASSWLWVGGEFEREDRRERYELGPELKLWRLTLDGEVDRTCELPYQHGHIRKLEPIDGGRNLNVFADTGSLIEQVVYDSNCIFVRGPRTLARDGNEVGPIVAVEGIDGRYVSLSKRGDRGFYMSVDSPTSRFNESVRPTEPEGRAPASAFWGGAIGISDDGTLSVVTGYALNAFATDGLVTRTLTSMPGSVSARQLIHDATGRVWLPTFDGVASIDPDGTSRLHGDGGASVLALARSGERVLALLNSTEAGPSIAEFADGSAVSRPILSDETPVDLDLQAEIVLLRTEQTLQHLGTAPETTWQTALRGDGPNVTVVDAVLAHDGGLVALLEMHELRLPPPFDDPPQTLGDSDLALLKLTARGQPQWLRVYGAAGSERATEIVRTQFGYAVLAESDSFDAVTPGSIDIWVLQTGVDGHIEADDNGQEFCTACLGSLSGQALLDFLPLSFGSTEPLGEPLPITYERERDMVEAVGAVQSTITTENTARQCFGDATDTQEPPAIAETPPTTYTVAVEVLIDGGQAASGGRVTSTPTGIDCPDGGSVCNATFNANAEVQLAASAADGFEFDGWTSADASAPCASLTEPVIYFLLTGNTTCIASFISTAPTSTSEISLTFIQPLDRPGRVIDDNTGRLDCTSNCILTLPIAESPIRLRALETDSTWAGWTGCDDLVEDPAGPPLCRVDITTGPRAITVEFR